MTSDAPISRHLDLFRYWLAKRGDLPMPARRDIDPSEMRTLLPHIGLIERDQDGYRWRLMGTAIAADLGRDLTGRKFGAYIADLEYVKAVMPIFDQVLASGRAMFEDSVYRTRFGTLHSVSRLVLPLSTDSGALPMLLITRIARFHRSVQAGRNWLNGSTGILRGAFPIASLEDLESRAVAWDRANR